MKYKKQKGTALLMTILLAGVISSLAFGLTKITLNEFFVGTKTEEGTEAYYAAEAGVQDALMRYKFHDKNNLEMPNDATQESNRVVRVYVNRERVAGKAASVNGGSRPSLGENDYVYDLKVWYKEDCFSEPCEYVLKKDESALFDVSNLSSGNLRVIWRVPGNNSGNRADAKLWYRIYDPSNGRNINDPRGLDRDFFTYLAYFNESQNPARNIPELNGFALPRGSARTISLLGGQALKFKAFGADIRLLLQTVRPNEFLGGPVTHIESTGYYGNTARKLEVLVDRNTKSIIDVFDYVIYSGADALP